MSGSSIILQLDSITYTTVSIGYLSNFQNNEVEYDHGVANNAEI